MPGNDDGEDGMRSAIIAALLFGISCASAHAADIAAGKEKAELCVGCHGENGVSQTENTPSLAAQPDQFIQFPDIGAFLVASLLHFYSGQPMHFYSGVDTFAERTSISAATVA